MVKAIRPPGCGCPPSWLQLSGVLLPLFLLLRVFSWGRNPASQASIVFTTFSTYCCARATLIPIFHRLVNLSRKRLPAVGWAGMVAWHISFFTIFPVLLPPGGTHDYRSLCCLARVVPPIAYPGCRRVHAAMAAEEKAPGSCTAVPLAPATAPCTRRPRPSTPATPRGCSSRRPRHAHDPDWRCSTADGPEEEHPRYDHAVIHHNRLISGRDPRRLVSLAGPRRGIGDLSCLPCSVGLPSRITPPFPTRRS